MVTNDFLPFCPNDTGTNLESQSDYIADTDRTDGNQPGVASSKLNNKALRQGTFIASQLAQYVSDQLTSNVSDDGVTAEFLAQLNAVMKPIGPNITQLVSGSGNWNMNYAIFCASANATNGATYSNNAVTFTVVGTIAAGKLLRVTGNGAPTVSGTLTKTGGTGDATITFYAVRAPLYLIAKVQAGGGGGAGSGGSPGTAGVGNASTFGTSLLATNPGIQGVSTGNGGAGGVAGTINAPAVAIFNSGGGGGGGGGNGVFNGAGPLGGASYFGSGGLGAAVSGTVGAALAYGAGGAGGPGAGSVAAAAAGGAGSYLEAQIPSPASTYAYVVGAGGVGGTLGSGTGANNGGAAGNGIIVIEEHYQ